MSFAVYEPTTLPEALSLMGQEGDAGAPLAGGTDLLLRIRRGIRKYRSVINLKGVPGLDGLVWDDTHGLTLGALTTFRTVELDPMVRSHYPALAEAARVVAGVQLRNIATIGGNLGNASPSADSLPPLVALGATVEIASPTGRRSIPVEACMTGPGRSVLSPQEIFTSVHIPAPPRGSGNAFARFSPRQAMDIGIVSVAVALTLDADGRCSDCRISLGAVSPTPLRGIAAENAIKGEHITSALAAQAGVLAAASTKPISDIRGSAEYRRAMVRVLTGRMIELAASRAAAGGLS